VATQIQCKAVETGSETTCQRAEHVSVEAGRVYEQGRRPVTSEVVQGNGYAIGGRGSGGLHWAAG
jgi:glucose/arabinose dehydrogenase